MLGAVNLIEQEALVDVRTLASSQQRAPALTREPIRFQTALVM